MFGKIENGRLIIAGRIVKEGNTTITNPTNEILLKLGYKEVVYTEKPKYDTDTEKLSETYKYNGKNIEISYTKEELSNEEKNSVIDTKISSDISSISKLEILKAITGDKEAVSKIDGVIKNITSNESKKVGIKGE